MGIGCTKEAVKEAKERWKDNILSLKEGDGKDGKI
jgi:hypothetical protein